MLSGSGISSVVSRQESEEWRVENCECYCLTVVTQCVFHYGLCYIYDYYLFRKSICIDIKYYI